MEIGCKFNTLMLKEYKYYITHAKKYTDFNTLGLYRSITENEKLSLEDKIELRDFANQYFGRFFNFLQIKDPGTYLELIHLGQELNPQQERRAWQELKQSQARILKSKRIRERNFGIYSKHVCGIESCPLNGIMIHYGSVLSDRAEMNFETDKRYIHSQRGKVKLRRERNWADLAIYEAKQDYYESR